MGKKIDFNTKINLEPAMRRAKQAPDYTQKIKLKWEIFSR